MPGRRIYMGMYIEQERYVNKMSVSISSGDDLQKMIEKYNQELMRTYQRSALSQQPAAVMDNTPAAADPAPVSAVPAKADASAGAGRPKPLPGRQRKRSYRRAFPSKRKTNGHRRRHRKKAGCRPPTKTTACQMTPLYPAKRKRRSRKLPPHRKGFRIRRTKSDSCRCACSPQTAPSRSATPM